MEEKNKRINVKLIIIVVTFSCIFGWDFLFQR